MTSIEMQMVLLHELFEKSVKRCIPINPKYKVIRLDQYDELMAYFDTTPWGIHQKEIDAQVREALHGEPTPC
jgi:hypothetical protein